MDLQYDQFSLSHRKRFWAHRICKTDVLVENENIIYTSVCAINRTIKLAKGDNNEPILCLCHTCKETKKRLAWHAGTVFMKLNQSVKN